MTLDAVLDDLRARVVDGKAAEMAAYHKIDRPYLGVSNPDIDEVQKHWRAQLDVPARVELARALWDTNIYEARVLATKLLNQARLTPDDGAWDLIQSWVPDFDSWAIADHACMAGRKRLEADPSRIDAVELWTTSPHMWTRRAALVITLPWTRQNNPKPADLIIRDRILGWAASYVDDKEWFIQKAVAWWIRDLSKHDPDRARAFVDTYGPRLKRFAQREATKYL